MANQATNEALSELKALARELRIKSDAIATAADAVALACDDGQSCDGYDALAEICADRLQANADKASETARQLVLDMRMLDMRIADVWDTLEEL